MWGIHLASICVVLATSVRHSSTQGLPIVEIGSIITSSNVSSNVLGYTYLLKDVALDAGIIFAFSAYFISYQPVRLQVWRQSPAPEGMDTNLDYFTLIWELRVLPSVIYAREDIYVESKFTTNCTHVLEGDRVGIFFEGIPSAIPYVFDAQNPSALTSLLTNLTDYNVVGSVAAFDTLTFPYDFVVSAYIDTRLGAYINSTSNTVPCPNTLIPTNTPAAATSAPITVVGPPGPEGPAGPVGPAGPPGQVGPPGIPGSYTVQGNETGTSPSLGTPSPLSLLDVVLLIWLILLTIAFIIFIIVAVCTYRRIKRNAYVSKSALTEPPLQFSNEALAASVTSNTRLGSATLEQGNNCDLRFSTLDTQNSKSDHSKVRHRLSSSSLTKKDESGTDRAWLSLHDENLREERESQYSLDALSGAAGRRGQGPGDDNEGETTPGLGMYGTLKDEGESDYPHESLDVSLKRTAKAPSGGGLNSPSGGGMGGRQQGDSKEDGKVVNQSNRDSVFPPIEEDVIFEGTG